MGHTFCLLTLIAGQAAPAPLMPMQPTSGQNRNCDCDNQAQQSGGMLSRVRGWFRGPDRFAERPGLVNRVRDRFGSGDSHYAQNASPQAPVAQMQPQVQPQMRPVQTAMPARARPQARPSMDVTSEPELARPLTHTTSFRPQQSARTETKPAKINPKFVNKIGHEDDYSWITGQLDQENGRWLIRYATPETVDRYKGQIFLAAGANVTQLRAGDLVSATGQVIGQVIGQGTSVFYRVATINLIERD